MSGGSSPSSSKKTVPPFASTNGDTLRDTAPVKAPFSCPSPHAPSGRCDFSAARRRVRRAARVGPDRAVRRRRGVDQRLPAGHHAVAGAANERRGAVRVAGAHLGAAAGTGRARGARGGPAAAGHEPAEAADLAVRAARRPRAGGGRSAGVVVSRAGVADAAAAGAARGPEAEAGRHGRVTAVDGARRARRALRVHRARRGARRRGAGARRARGRPAAAPAAAAAARSADDSSAAARPRRRSAAAAAGSGAARPPAGREAPGVVAEPEAIVGPTATGHRDSDDHADRNDTRKSSSHGASPDLGGRAG